MVSFLAKRWFLMVVVIGVIVAWFWPALLAWTQSDWVQPSVVMALALFLSAWTMESRSLYQSLLWPWAALWAAAISYGLLPALSWLSGSWLLSVPEFRLGLMISASVPCTLASAVLWTRMAGGHEATALLTTFLTTAMSWLATTAWLAWATGTAVDTTAMMANLALVLMLPVAVGQLARAPAALREVAFRLRSQLGLLSRLLILLIMLRAAAKATEQLGSQAAVFGIGSLLLTAALCIGLHLLALFGGFGSGMLLGFDRPVRIAIGIAGSQKTLPVSLALLDRFFPDYPLAVVPMLFYHAGQLIADTFIAEQWAQRADVHKHPDAYAARLAADSVQESHESN
jgi:sodium/bile acid cotransporter 7